MISQGSRDPNMDECEELSKEIIDKHFVIQILLAFPKLDFEVSVFSGRIG